MALTVITDIKILAGESLSNSIDCSEGNLVRITMPADWTSANLTFQVSTDGNGYNDLYDAMGHEITMVVVPGAAVPIIDLAGWTKMLAFLRFRSGTRNFPVEQPADREFAVTLDVVP